MFHVENFRSMDLFLSWVLSCQYVYFFLLEFINLQGFASNILSVKTMFCHLIVKPSSLIYYAELARLFQDEQSNASVPATGHHVMCLLCPHGYHISCFVVRVSVP